MDVLCLGMYRAGSTWQYDVAAELLERHRDAVRLGFVVGPDYRSGPLSDWRVLKSHDVHEDFAAALQSGQALALYSWRDLREVCFSLMHKLAADFDTIAGDWLFRCLDNDAFWRAQPNVLGQCYEAILAEPANAVEEIARYLRITLEGGEARAVAEKYSLGANRLRMDAFAKRLRDQGVDLADPANAARWDGETLLHWNHIRSGEAGGWQAKATPRQRIVLAALCGEWLIQLGYEANREWAEATPDLLTAELARTLREARVARERCAELQREKVELADLGPTALDLARKAQRWSLRFPRLAATLKRIGGSSRER